MQRNFLEWRGIRYLTGTRDDVAHWMLDEAVAAQGHLILTVNVSILRQLTLLEGIDRSWVTAVFDGNPVRRLAAREMNVAPPERVTGADLITTIPSRVVDRSMSVTTVVVGSQGIEAAAALRERLPGAAAVGIDFPGDVSVPAGVAAQIAPQLPVGPAVVFLCFGYPKQERVAASLHGLRPDLVYVGAGASADFLVGRVTRAPAIVQRLGLEWLWRMLSEPRRLLRRYLIDDLPFIAREWITAPRRRSA